MKCSSVVLLSFSAFLWSCGDDDSSTTTPTNVTIDFAAVAGTQSIACDTVLTGLGLNEESATISDFRFYIHDIALTRDDGSSESISLEDNAWQSDGVALLDFQNKADSCSGDDKETRTTVTGTVSNGTSITGISFTLGIPETLNHQDQSSASTPLNIISLFWSWNSGYKFLRADVTLTDGITRPSDDTFSGSSFNIHLGSTGCTGDATQGDVVTCTNANRKQVSLDNFVIDESTVTLDYAALIANNTLSVDEGERPDACRVLLILSVEVSSPVWGWICLRVLRRQQSKPYFLFDKSGALPRSAE